MSEPRPYAKMGVKGAFHARLVGLLGPPSEMTPAQASRLRAKVAQLSAKPARAETWRLASVVAAASVTALAIAVIGAAVRLLAAPAIQVPAVVPPPAAAAPAAAPGEMVISPHSLPTAAPAKTVTAAAPILKPPSPGEAPDNTLLRELRLVDAAKSTLRRGEAAKALEKLREHEATFPKGQLRSERDVLTVETLEALGRHTEAETRARALRQREPGSPYARRALAAASLELPSSEKEHVAR